MLNELEKMAWFWVRDDKKVTEIEGNYEFCDGKSQKMSTLESQSLKH